jgi:2-oxoglutarate ferredoxin oxidoreductase subunit gamma
MNMIVLGAFLELRSLVPLEAVLEALRHVLPERHHHLIPLNQQALERGRELVKRSTESLVH